LNCARAAHLPHHEIEPEDRMAAPHDEAIRQRVLDTYRVVDSLPEVAYDDIVQLASIICDAPMALMSLVDRDRQWFKASRGLGGTGSRRDEAFCAHAIEAPTTLMEVRDARQDERFLTNPFVTGDVGLRFYAGMPLVTPGGEAIGTVCVLDNKPRALDARQREGLKSLARLTMTLLDARLHEHELERAVMLAEANARPPEMRFAVVILQVQGFAEHAQRMGERALERQLHDLERNFVEVVDASLGDSVNRTSHSADFIAVLHGDGAAATEQRLRDRADAFSARSGIPFAVASATSIDATERIEQVFLRADEALTEAKDARVMAAA
jgi:GAF domain-containing protein